MVITGDVHRVVSDVLVRYATGIDRRDWVLFGTCFTDDCVADYGEIGTWRSVAEITEFMRTTHEPCGHTMHRISNIALEPVGDDVAARSYVDALIMMAGNRTGVRALGYYDDRLVATDDGWRIAERRFTSVLFQMIESDAPPGHAPA